MKSVEPALKHQHRSHNMLQAKANIGVARRDFQDSTASVSTLPSSTPDERLQRHVLKIDISPESPKKTVKCLLRNNVSIMSISQEQSLCSEATTMGQKPFEGNLSDDQKLVLSVTDSGTTCCIRSKNEVKLSNGNMRGKSFNGKCSPDEHIDSGTCSDAEITFFHPSSESPQPPALPPKMNRKKQHVLSESFCSDTSSASSSDSAQNNEHLMSDNHLVSPNLIRSIIEDHHKVAKTDPIALLPTSLLIDIRNRSVDFRDSLDQDKSSSDEQDEQESNCSDLELCNRNSIDEKLVMNYYSDDSFYKFHINENLSYELDAYKMTHDESDESFAGLKDLRSGTSTIRSKNGTIRGIKNRVRSGISTFLQMQQTTVKNYKDKDGGKIVVYLTSMGVVRSTYAKCQLVKKILNTLMVKFEERDVFMSQVHQQEIRDRMESDEIDIPQVFVDGQYIGNADQVERFNEMGELRKMLKTFKCLDSIKTCRICGGFNMLPCPSCGGSKKSIHRNHFTSEFVALKCMNCDEVGLVRCYSCS